MVLKTEQPRGVKRSAFTLMEMLVVVAILVVLAGAAIPIYLSYLDRARIDRAKIDIKTLEGAVDAYAAQNGGVYPQTLQELTVANPNTGQRAYLDQTTLVDPWGDFYVLDPNQQHPTTFKPKIYSLGPSKNQQTMISNW
ncbi:MAG: type II secretion system protein GspG [Gemmataceae bacterium]|nr:type II secretion system protein GspG [Gemmataceae bacterium]